MTDTGYERVTERVPPLEIPALDPARVLEERSLAGCVAYLLSGDHASLPDADAVRGSLERELPSRLSAAFGDGDEAALLDVHRALYELYETSFANPLAPSCAHERSPWASRLRQAVESAWLAAELPAVEEELREVGGALGDARVLAEWFTRKAREESQLDRDVVGYLAASATREDFELFVLSEAQLNYRFYDALALAQLHFSESVKAEISRHMWDECGCGERQQAHTQQFTRSLESLGLGAAVGAPPIWNDWRPYAGYDLYLLLGLNRRHWFKAVGSLAMPELFDPDRDRAVVTGLERLGFAAGDFEYFYSHIEGDEDHGPSWVENVLVPIVSLQPEAGRELAIGGCLRMTAMRRYNEHLARRFGLVA